MTAIRVETTIQNDGELRISNLPCRKGDVVEAIVLLPEAKQSEERGTALERFLTLARNSRFRSNGPYPTRNELHERS